MATCRKDSGIRDSARAADARTLKRPGGGGDHREVTSGLWWSRRRISKRERAVASPLTWPDAIVIATFANARQRGRSCNRQPRPAPGGVAAPGRCCVFDQEEKKSKRLNPVSQHERGSSTVAEVRFATRGRGCACSFCLSDFIAHAGRNGAPGTTVHDSAD
jgi:hypothetical protein